MNTRRPLALLVALAAVGAAAPLHAAKPGSCRPTFAVSPDPLNVEADSGTLTATWPEVESLAKEASKYSVEVTAHYDAHADVRFTFTAPDGDPGVLDTASFSVGTSALDTTVCTDPPDCTSSETHSATSATVQVKALNPPSKGKEGAQCNPFSAPVTVALGNDFCAVADPPYSGAFTVLADAWADYEIGDLVPVVLDPVLPDTFRILATSNPFIGNSATAYMIVTVDPLTGAATVTGNECFDYGPGFCLDVSGTGSADCSGNVDLTINYGGFTGYALSIRPQ